MGNEKQKTVLLVEDEAITAMAKKMALERYGYKVITVLSGEEAVATVETTPGIDLILMDINLGSGMDGTEAAAAILHKRDMPVVFLSSHMEQEMVEKTEKITSYGYVVKDSSITVLDASIKMAFKLFKAKTKEQEKENALQESEAKLNLALRSANMGVWQWDIKTDRRVFDEQVCRLLGLNPATFKGTADEFFASVHPSDHETIKAALARVMAQDVLYNPEYRVVWPDGSIHHINARGRLSRDEAGRPQKINGTIWEITDRKLAEEEKEQIISLQKATIESTADGILVINSSGKIKDFNRRFTEMWNIPDSVLAARDDAQVLDFVLGQLRDPQGFLAKVNELYATPGQESFDLLQFKDGRCFERYSQPQQISGRPVGRVWSFRDISERRRSETERLALLEVMQGLAVTENLHDFLKNLHVSISKAMYAENFFVVLFNKDTALFEEAYSVDKFDGPSPPTTLEKSISGYVFRSGQPLLLTQEQFEELAARGEVNLVGTRSASWLGVPLKTRSGTIGVMVVQDYDMENRYAKREMDFFISIAGQVALVVERMQAEEALRKSEERLRDILLSMADWVWEIDANGFYTYSSEKVLDVFGTSPEDIIGKTPFDFMPANEAKKVAAIFSKIMVKKAPIKDLENWNVGRNGDRICLLTNGVPILDEKGDLKGYRGVDKDITLRKRAEKLNETLYKISQAVYTTENLNKLFEHVHRALSDIIPTDNLYIALLDDDGKALTFPYFIDEKDTGDRSPIEVDNAQSLTVEVFTKKKALLLDEEELLERYTSGRNKVWVTAPKCWLGVPLITRETIIGVMVVQDYHKRGAYRPKDVALLESTAGQIAVAIAHKRTESQREAARVALRESEKKFHDIFENVLDAYYETAIDGTILEVSPSIEFVSSGQFRREELIGKSMNDFYIDSGKRQTFLRSLQENGKVTDYEILLKNRDGLSIPCSISSKIHFDQQGRPAKILGTVRNITERKQAEEEIKRQLAEKEILLREVHHRIKNNIASIGGLITLRMQSVSNPQAIAVLKDAVSRINSMRILYDKLLLGETYKDVPVKNYVESLADTVIALFPDSAKITIDKRIADFHLDTKRLFPLGIIINEILTNIMKYAFSNRKRGMIKISLTNANGQVTLFIEDNGIGLPVGFDLNESKGFGLMLVKMLSQQLGGSFAMETRKGTRCEVEFAL